MPNTFDTFIGEADLIVRYDYQPPEKKTLEYPGCPAAVEIVEVLSVKDLAKKNLFKNIVNRISPKWLAQLEERAFIDAAEREQAKFDFED